MNKENAKLLLNDVTNVLEKCGLRYFLADGTLLGAIREGDFIEHDQDVDLGVFAEEWKELTVGTVVTEMLNKGIATAHMFGELDKYFEMALRRDGVKCDLFFYRREGDKRIFHAFKNGGRTLPDDVITYEYPAALIENVHTLMFQRRAYLAPADPVKVVEIKYGPEWRTPVKNWDWMYGPKNVRKA